MLRYRLHPTPLRAMPLNVRSAGHYRLEPGRREPRDPGDFFQLFWSVSGQGEMRLGKTVRTIRPGAVFHYAAGEPHDLRAGPAGWEYRWLTFDGPGFARIVADHGLARARHAGPCPEHLFVELDACLRDATAAGEFRASVLAYEILLLAGAPSATTGEPDADDTASGSDAARAKAWLDAHFADARLNVSALAARLRLHRATLHRVFVKHYGIPPVRYLSRLRLRLALELLGDTRLPVADIAARCGIPDLPYFSRLVARHTSHGPREYRRRHSAAGMTTT